MITRGNSTDSPQSSAPTCWHREAQGACLRVELPSSEAHLFSYQHFVTASLKRNDSGSELLRITFSTHEVEIEGRGLRELLLGLQDFAVKWLRATPERYHPLAVGAEGVITTVRITAAE
jgi:hypothetical protein